MEEENHMMRISNLEYHLVFLLIQLPLSGVLLNQSIYFLISLLMAQNSTVVGMFVVW